MSEVTRRDLVKRTGLLVVLPALAPALGSCARILSEERRIAMPSPDKAGNITFLKSLAPELATAGGGVVLHFPDGSNWRPALIANAGNGLVAVQGDCPHEACDLTWVQGDFEVECPCHGSRFASDGTLLNPPAAVDLLPFKIDEDEDSYTVHCAPGDGFYPTPAGDGTLTISIADYPALATPGGSISGFPEGLSGPLLVVRENESTVAAFSGVCPHLGCYVQRQATDFHCPCHGSTFQISGAFIPGSGPANAPLKPFNLVNTFDPAVGVVVIQIL